MIEVEIPFPPKALQRHRHHGKQTFDPQKKDKQHLQWWFKSEYLDMPPFGEIASVEFDFYMPIPKSYSKKKYEAMKNKPHVIKPDLSNLIKFYEDALNGILWKDDAILHKIAARKVYSSHPRVEIRIYERL